MELIYTGICYYQGGTKVAIINYDRIKELQFYFIKLVVNSKFINLI